MQFLQVGFVGGVAGIKKMNKLHRSGAHFYIEWANRRDETRGKKVHVEKPLNFRSENMSLEEICKNYHVHVQKTCKIIVIYRWWESGETVGLRKCYVFIWFLNTSWILILSRILKSIGFWVWGLIIIRNKYLGFRVSLSSACWVWRAFYLDEIGALHPGSHAQRPRAAHPFRPRL